ncbi:non-ribosomal peptide synthetase [Chitinophaga varians]|uniref:non-ribosomal peptide synthetase n=1 Tax=Chitinophaga varians TaxID=2202339 RepID=UPI00165FEAB5|nr:non-ribosomal peptide synthetase [Chitinophaga varians]MBC9913419.1 amino acid adenylation domain-containing protein [Chitinophaga varians]
MTLTELIRERSCLTGKGITFIEGSSQQVLLSYSDLYAVALNVLGYLQQCGVRQGDELVLQVPANRDFVVLFWACILGGIIPVPLSTGTNEENRSKLFAVWQVLQRPYLVAGSDELARLRDLAQARGETLLLAQLDRQALSVSDIYSSQQPGVVYPATPDDIAFIQFSSGSTGTPKGVTLTHQNLLCNVEAISEAGRYTPDDMMVSWMPLTHDMGLIGFHLNPLFAAMHQCLIPTPLFIRRPAIWMDVATQYKATVLCSPNFGYRYLLKHMGDGVPDWDLSAVRILYNGAEPIAADLCREFLDVFGRFGLRPSAMCPVYGLAEATLAVSFSDPEAVVMAVQIDREHVGIGDHIVLKEGEEGATFVNVGMPVKYCSVRIVDSNGSEAAAEVIGHIQIKGANVTRGYYNNKAETLRLISADGWLDTGDLGFMHEGALYVTGRYKDIIFQHGENYYPHDIERIAEEIDGIELNRIAVAGFFNSDTQQEVVVAFVMHRGDLRLFLPLVSQLKAHINVRTGIRIDVVAPVREIPKTTSGKLQRFKLLERFKRGEFAAVVEEIEMLTAGQLTEKTGGLPDNAQEQRILDIWKTVLDNNLITVTDRFFEAGGNSLKTMEMALMVEQELDVEIPATLLYKAETVRELSAAIDGLSRREHQAIPAAAAQEYYPVAPVQRRIYYAWQLDRESVAYNNPVALELKEAVDVTKLQQCIRDMIAANESLRMSFHAMGEPVFRVHNEVAFSITVVDCQGGLPDALLRLHVKPFDLTAAPLFRAILFRTSPDNSVLLLDFHHIISDGLSVFYFIDRLFRAYEGKETILPSIRYRDYAVWANKALQEERINKQRSFWKQYLHESIPALELPVDMVRPAIMKTEGRKYFFTLGGKEKEADHLMKGLGASRHQFFFAVYQLLLSKYTGRNEILTGIPVAGRNHAALGGVLGMFVNNLPVYTHIDDDLSFRELLAGIKGDLEAVLQQQELPFDELVAATGIKRDASRSPLFDTMFVYQNMGFPKLENVSRYPFDPGFSKFDLSLEIFDEDKEISCAIEYNLALFSAASIERMAAHFRVLVAQVAMHPDKPVSTLSMLTGREYAAHVHTYNDSFFEYPTEVPVHSLFKRMATRVPDSTALEYREEKLTYRQLDERAERLAAFLLQRGIGENKVVAVMMERSPALVISILAVMKTGACFLPVDRELPEERMVFMLNDSQCALLLVDDSIHRDLSRWETVRINSVDLTAGPLFRTNPGMADTGHTAYIIYTSGTTGNPKGVMISHRSLTNYISWAATTYVKKEIVAFPLFTSISFDLTLTSLFTPLITGCRLIIYPDDPDNFVMENIIRDNRVQVVKLTPSHLRLLKNISLPEDGSAIRRFIVGGEDMSTQLASDIDSRFGGNVEIYNEYGPTEATVGCMIHLFKKDTTTKSVPIGVPSGNMQIYLLDRYLQPVPTGVPGEIYISGDGLAKGYLNQEELTDQKFITNPFNKGTKMYKTGDLARRLPDGSLEFAGRIDEQVKINGYRVELSEIRQQLLTCGGVADAMVLVKKNEADYRFLCAYYIAEKDIEEIILKEHLAEKLPYYMVPAYFIRIGHFPLTRNGKVDVTALPDAGAIRKSKTEGWEESELLRQMQEVWSDIFQAPVSVADNFFELGGDSIKALQIVSRLLQKDIVVNTRDILLYHTIQQISKRVEKQGASHSHQGITAGSRRLNPVETWFFHQHFHNPHYYNQSVLLRAKRSLDPVLLGEVFRTLLEHHDGLRSNYDPVSGKMFYNNGRLHQPFAVEVWDLDENMAVADICAQQKAKFDIFNGCLLKALLLRRTGQPDLLMITAHHLVIDGVSWRIVLEDLYQLYLAAMEGSRYRLPLKTASVAVWVDALYATSTGNLQPEEDECFEVPQDFETTDWRIAVQKTVSGQLDAEATERLLKHSYGLTAETLLVTALVKMLHEWTQQDHINIEMETHGRHQDTPDVSRTVGWFTGICPVVFELQPGSSVVEYISAVRKKLQELPARSMQYGIDRYLHSEVAKPEQIAAVRFNYLGQFEHELENSLFTYEPLNTGGDIDPANRLTARLDFNLMIIGGTLRADIGYNSTAYEQGTMLRLRDQFLDQLAAIQEIVSGQDEWMTMDGGFTADLNTKDMDSLFD